MAVTLTEVETAIRDLFSGKTTVTLDKGSIAVEVFVDDPDPEEYPERVIPSIAIDFADMFEDTAVSSSEEYDLISMDESSIPYIGTFRRASVWYRVAYMVHTWAGDAPSDRDLVRWVESRKKPRDSIQIGSEHCYLFRTGFNKLDEVDNDRKIYHKVWRLEVLADIDNSDTDEDVPQVHELHFRTYLVQTRPRDEDAGVGRTEGVRQGGVPSADERTTLVPINDLGETVIAIDATWIQNREVVLDESDYWFPTP